MAVQPSYPGVYVDEFEPGAPIQGVGTNTAVFLGIAASGPRNTPTLVSSWDQFVSMFGGFMSDPNGWLGKGVYGFFGNGGTRCYVVRVSSAQTAVAYLPARKSGNALRATALAEGPAGNTIALWVTDTSRSEAAVAAVMTRQILKEDTDDHQTLTIAGGVADLHANDAVVITRGTASQNATIDAVTAPDTVKLTAALPNDLDFSSGTLRASFTVRVLVASANVTAMSADRTQLTLDTADHHFAPGDAVHVSHNGDTADGFVSDVSGAVVTVTPPLGGAADFSGGAIRTADLLQSGGRLRLSTPTGLSLSAAFPAGSLLAVTPNAAATVFVRVAGSGGDTVQLDPPGLPNGIALTNQASAPTVSTAEFDLAVRAPAAPAAEIYRYLSMDSRSPGYWLDAVTSPTVSLSPADPMGAAADSGDDRPKAETHSTANGASDDYRASWTALMTSPDDYLRPLARLHDVQLVAVPGGTTATLQQAVVAHCEQVQDRFAVLDSAPHLDSTAVTNQFAHVRSAKGYAALYYPWITVTSPASRRQELWPPSGHIVGVYARTDTERGVHKAPANMNVRGALGVETVLSDGEQGPLNLLGVNVLRVFPGQSQPVVWGARTTAGDLDRNWQYVDIRRLFIYLEQSIEAGIRWAVFEPNDLSLWQKLKRSISNFLTQAWRDGALFGEKPEDAFYVRIDEALNPPSTRSLGRLYIEVGVVPTYPAEFIVLRIGIWDGGSEVSTG